LALREALRQVRNFHENEVLVAWWAVRLDRVSTWVNSGRRHQILSLASVGLLVVWVARKYPLPGPNFTLPPVMRVALAGPCIFGLLLLCYLTAVRFDRLPNMIRHRPQIALHLLFWTVLLVLWITPAEATLWRLLLLLLALILPDVLWRCGYLLKSGQRGRAKGTTLSDHLFYLWPVWRGSETPYGKGFDYLSRNDAPSVEAFARSQLAGLKLIFLVYVWKTAMLLMSGVVYGDPKSPLATMLHGYSLRVPRLETLVHGASTVPLALAWLSIYCDLVWQILRIAVKGHAYIGVLRLCGFNVFRNTYKPLLAESLVEFWNRYYYYFKELMVEFFFYPTFTRYRVRPWLRTLLAIFAAAFVGNTYYHLIQQVELLAVGDFAELWRVLHARIFYCFLLATGIYISMLREQRRRGQSENTRTGVARRIVRIAGVWTFYGVIHIWNMASGTATFGQRTRFFLSLLALE
jgi:hypothetical protein